MASCATKLGSVEGIAIACPRPCSCPSSAATWRESCRSSDGLGLTLKKWVVTCFPSSLSNSVASGVKSINWKPSSVGRQM